MESVGFFLCTQVVDKRIHFNTQCMTSCYCHGLDVRLCVSMYLRVFVCVKEFYRNSQPLIYQHSRTILEPQITSSVGEHTVRHRCWTEAGLCRTWTWPRTNHIWSCCKNGWESCKSDFPLNIQVKSFNSIHFIGCFFTQNANLVCAVTTQAHTLKSWSVCQIILFFFFLLLITFVGYYIVNYAHRLSFYKRAWFRN